jgi:hypothetical protein
VGHGLPLNYITVLFDLGKFAHVYAGDFRVKLHTHFQSIETMTVPTLVASARHVQLGLAAVFYSCPLFADGAEHYSSHSTLRSQQ